MEQDFLDRFDIPDVQPEEAVRTFVGREGHRHAPRRRPRPALDRGLGDGLADTDGEQTVHDIQPGVSNMPPQLADSSPGSLLEVLEREPLSAS